MNQSEETRVGVFICHCGRNIAGVIDVKKLVEEVRKIPGVVYVEDYVYMCSEPGQKKIIDAIKRENLNRVVVAACTPSMHYETFAKAVEAGGLSRFLFEMAVIREFSSWVHYHERDKATEKALRIIKSIVAKVRENKSYSMIRSNVVKKVLVIGGGIAGITAALDIANAGIPVILVEKSPTIGGKMAMLSETFPTLDCAQCILTPRMAEAGRHSSIKLYTLSEVIDVEGFVGNYRVRILKHPRKVDPNKCTVCSFCERVCPVKVPSEFNRGLSYRKAIYIPFPQAIPSSYAIDTANCTKCGLCVKVCPVNAINLDEQEEIVEENIGAIIIATGYDLYPGERLREYGYGKFRNVIDSLQFERILSSSGPTGGEVRRPSDGKLVKTIVFIQCAGQRDVLHLPYCSKICCMYTAKHVLLFKERVPDSSAYVFYIDIRAAGKGYEEFVKRVQDETGAVYIRGRVSRIYEESGGSVVVEGVDTLTGENIVVKADLVVLALGMIPSISRELVSKLKAPVDEYGFIQEVHPKLRPVELATSGVFVAGAVQGAKDISETVVQASAAASKALQLVVREAIEKDPIVAEVNRDLCNGCRICISICPYGALEVTNGKARVNEVLCEGCGACVASCPVGAITLRNNSDIQLFEMIKSALRG